MGESPKNPFPKRPRVVFGDVFLGSHGHLVSDLEVAVPALVPTADDPVTPVIEPPSTGATGTGFGNGLDEAL